MTQHINPEHTLEDQATMRRLSFVIMGFVAFSVAGAIAISLIAG